MPYRWRRCMLCLAALAIVTLSGGCGGTPELAPVSGTVLVDGEPVDGAQVLFMPPGKRPAAGQTDADGRFTLSTYDKNDGAALGVHNVTIMYQRPIRVQPMPMPGVEPQADPTRNVEPLPKDWKSPIPAKYANPAAPLLSAEVKDEKNDFTFELEW